MKEECQCRDPNHNFAEGRSCKKIYLAADGVCDDENNFKACNFDGGDCCLTPLNRSRCLYCLCTDMHHPNHCRSFYDYKTTLGNGWCDPNLNHKFCHYDMGDCCVPEMFKKYSQACGNGNCTCQCIDPLRRFVDFVLLQGG